MTDFVLVHGAWHGRWCWKYTAAGLHQAGHRVFLPELPGHGDDTTPAAGITAEMYEEAVLGVLPHDASQFILVGHSLGGMVISRVAERIPDRIARLIYVAAFLLEDGMCINDTEPLMGESAVSAALALDRRQRTLDLPESVLPGALYHDCDPAMLAEAMAHYRPEPLGPFLTPVRISAARYGRIPRSYVECLQDRAIPVSAQRAMQRQLPCQTVSTLDSSHSPFLSLPAALAAALIREAGSAE